jgi:hypothetical protein
VQEKDTKRLRDTIAGLNADVRESRSLAVKVASLEATNRALTEAATNQKEMLQASQLALSKSVTLEMFTAVQHASSQPVLDAIHAVNGTPYGERKAASDPADQPPKSKQDVAAFLGGLEWSSNQIDQFSSVTGESLLFDVTPKMCREFGVSDIELLTLTRRLQQWRKDWGAS